jgi:hypothetical protein
VDVSVTSWLNHPARAPARMLPSFSGPSAPDPREEGCAKHGHFETPAHQQMPSSVRHLNMSVWWCCRTTPLSRPCPADPDGTNSGRHACPVPCPRGCGTEQDVDALRWLVTKLSPWRSP